MTRRCQRSRYTSRTWGLPLQIKGGRVPRRDVNMQEACFDSRHGCGIAGLPSRRDRTNVFRQHNVTCVARAADLVVDRCSPTNHREDKPAVCRQGRRREKIALIPCWHLVIRTHPKQQRGNPPLAMRHSPFVRLVRVYLVDGTSLHMLSERFAIFIIPVESESTISIYCKITGSRMLGASSTTS